MFDFANVPGWPILDGAPVTLERLVALLSRRNAWAEEVHQLGVDAPSFPLTIDEEQAVRDAKLAIQMVLLVAETEQFLKDDEGPG